MDEKFVTIELTEFEFDAIVEWLGEQEIASDLYNLYDRLIKASCAPEEEEFASEEEEE